MDRDCKKFIEDFEDNSNFKIKSPKTGKMILNRSPNTIKIYKDICEGEKIQNDKDDYEKIEYDDDNYADQFMDAMDNLDVEFINSPITNRKISRYGSTAFKLYHDIMQNNVPDRKSPKRKSSGKKSPVRRKPVNKKVSEDNGTCESFVEEYRKLKRSGKEGLIKKPGSIRKLKNTGKAAEREFKNCLENNPNLSYSKRKGNCFERSDVELKEYQKNVSNFLLKDKNKGMIAAFATGTGKTLSAIAASQCLLDKNPKANVVIVAPKNLIQNFKKEMERYGIEGDDLRYNLVSIGSSKHLEKYCNEETILIVDEAHNIRNRYQFYVTGEIKSGHNVFNIKKCAIKAWKVLLLTATPLFNSVDDLNMLLDLIGKKPVDFSGIAQNEEISIPYQKFYEKNKKNLECVIYFQDIDKNNEKFPPTTHIPLEIEMTKEYLQKYYIIEDREIRLADAKNNKKIAESNAFLSALRKASNALDETESGKVEASVNLIEKALEKDEKVVVYFYFVGSKKVNINGYNNPGTSFSRLKNILKEKGIKYGEFTGNVKESVRQKYLKDYNSGKLNVLLISSAGSEGLDLKGTNHLIINDIAFNEATMKQIEGRAVRYESHIGLPEDKNFVNIYHLILVKPKKGNLVNGKDILKPSSDQYMYQIIKDKQDRINVLTDYLKRMNDESTCFMA